MKTKKLYFEFTKQDYYGLVVVEVEQKEKETFADYYGYVKKAAQIYVDMIAGESSEEVLHEGAPSEVYDHYAYWKFAQIPEHQDKLNKEVLADFHSRTNDIILIDGSLT